MLTKVQMNTISTLLETESPKTYLHTCLPRNQCIFRANEKYLEIYHAIYYKIIIKQSA